MFILLSLFLFCLLIAYFITRLVRHNIIKSNSEYYLNVNEKSKFSKFNEVLVKFGVEYQQELEQKLIDAGIYHKKLAKYYLPIKLFLVAVAVFLVFVTSFSESSKIIFSLLIMIAVLLVPDISLELRKKILIARISSQLPYLLDMMSVCVQTGMTIEASLTYLSKELETFDKNLCYQIKKVSDTAKIHTLEKALNDFQHRVPTPEVRSFTLTLIQNLQYGTSIANVLSDLAEDIRKMQILTIEEKIGKLSAKMSVPLILFIMFPIVILILAPGMMQMSFNIG